MAFTHGIYTSEQATSVTAPVTSDAALTVVVGTAPIHTVGGNPDAVTNIPVEVTSYEDAVKKFGISDDWNTWTLSAVFDYYFRVRGVGPIVVINVYDGGYTSESVDVLTSKTVSTKAIEGSVWVADSKGKALTADTDYSVKYTDTGFTVTALTVSGEAATIYYHADSATTAFTKSDIISGLEKVKQVYPVLGLVPGIIIAPYWSQIPEVSAAMLAKSHSLNGSWEVMSYVDIDSSANGAETLSALKTEKEAQGLTDSNQYAVWLYGKVGDNVYPGSIVAAAQTAYVDSNNDDVPYYSPSNKATSLTGACTASGKAVYLDQEEANEANALGVATFLNRNGWKVWGNRTAAYPSNTDVKDAFINVRRMFNWRRNNFILTFFQKVDDVANYRLIESIVDSYNVTGNSYVQSGYAAVDSISFDIDENPVTELLNGNIKFHVIFSPFTPAETIETTFEFDPTALSTALSGE